MPRTGRRPGTTGRTRERILQAARQDFSNAGYDGVTIRGIAAQAKVDPALVLHYFESKDGMFRAAVEFPVDPKEFIPRLQHYLTDPNVTRLSRAPRRQSPSRGTGDRARSPHRSSRSRHS